MAGVGKLLKQAAKMQKKMEALQAELAEREITHQAGGGAVSLTLTLQQEVRALKIDPEFLREDAALVEETLLEAIREALAVSKEQQSEAMEAVTSEMQGMGGGLGGLLG